jgi:phosphoglycolate phosphatase
MIEYVFFDLDGTLTDPGEGITNSVAYSLRKNGIEPPPREELYKFIGPPLVDSYMKYYGFSYEGARRAVEDYREYFRDRGIFENKLYAGAVELLEVFTRTEKKIVLATSKPEPFAKTILSHFGLDKYFYFVAGALMDETRTKKGDVIRYALECCGSPERESVIMVGDREHDIIGARENGLCSIGVLYGYGSREELTAQGADFIAKTPQDVAEIILKL